MDTTSQTMAIAETILEQIQYGDRYALWAWGATNFVALHECWVKVCLRWVDDYTIVFINHNREVVKTSEGNYCDMLVPEIDWVEGK